MRNVKVYLDDVRKPPAGWVLCRWPQEVINLLITGQVEYMSLDHDLGDDSVGTGLDVLNWLEEKVFTENFNPPKFMYVHSKNPEMRIKMELIINRIINKVAES